MDIYYMSNGLTFALSNIFLRNFQDDAKWVENRVCKISWKSLENWLTGYQKANFHFGPFHTVGQTVGYTDSMALGMAQNLELQ